MKVLGLRTTWTSLLGLARSLCHSYAKHTKWKQPALVHCKDTLTTFMFKKDHLFFPQKSACQNVDCKLWQSCLGIVAENIENISPKLWERNHFNFFHMFLTKVQLPGLAHIDFYQKKSFLPYWFLPNQYGTLVCDRLPFSGGFHHMGLRKKQFVTNMMVIICTEKSRILLEENGFIRCKAMYDDSLFWYRASAAIS